MSKSLKNLTVDMTQLKRMPVADRVMLGKSSSVSDIFGNLTPSQIAELFPKYYRDTLPGIAGLMGATAGGTSSYSGGSSGGRSYGGGGSSSTSPAPTPPSLTDEILKKAGIQRPTPNAGVAKSPQEYFGPNVDVSKLPAGMRNNNPGNIKFNPDVKWAGLVGPSQNTDQGDPQAVFSSPEMGMRATAKLLMNKFHKNGFDTVNKMITSSSGWTPGNSQAAENIARTMGVGVNDTIDLNDPEVMKKLIRGLITQEHGPSSQLYSDQLIADGVRLATSEATATPELTNQNTYGGTDLNASGLVPDSATVSPNPALPFDVSKLTPELKKEYENASDSDKKLLERAITKLGYDEANKIHRQEPTATPVELAQAIDSARVEQRQAQLAGTRRLPLQPDLVNTMTYAAEKASEESGRNIKLKTFSGGQAAIGTAGPRTGSTEHDLGGASDSYYIEVMPDGTERQLHMSNPDDKKIMYRTAYYFARAGGRSVGLENSYMGDSVHLGISRNNADPVHHGDLELRQLVAQGHSEYLQDAQANGWDPRTGYKDFYQRTVIAQEQAAGNITPPADSSASAPVATQAPAAPAPSDSSAPPAATPTPASDIAQTPLVPPASSGQPTATPVEPPAKDPARLATGGVVPNSVNEDLSVTDNRTGEVLAQVSPNEKLSTTPNGLKVESAHQQVADQTMAENNVGSPVAPTPEKPKQPPAPVVGGMTSQAVDVQKIPDYLGEIAQMGTVVYSPSQARAMQQATLGNVRGHYSRGTEIG